MLHFVINLCLPTSYDVQFTSLCISICVASLHGHNFIFDFQKV